MPYLTSFALLGLVIGSITRSFFAEDPWQLFNSGIRQVVNLLYRMQS